MGPLSRRFLPNHTALCIKSFLSSPKKTDSVLHGSSGLRRSLSPARPRREHLRQRTCRQALYQSCPPPSPRKRSGHESVHDAVQPAWNDSGAVFEQTAETLGYALLDAHRFQRHGLRIEAELFEHWCVRKPDCQYSDVDTERL